MRIVYLELENIKSYAGRTRLDFTEGLNAISGHNGSGKSTVLEAIGWALFNSLPYKRDGFIREGQRSGTVRVGLMAADSRLYEVTRRIQPSAHYVTDVETNTRLASSNETLPWIRMQALNLDGEIDLKTLFETSVGVPQGTMTADFLKSGQPRKNVFDPLLRVDEYRRAWEELRASMSLVEGRSASLERDIENLAETAGRLPEVREQLTSALHALDEMRWEVEHITAELGRMHEQQVVLDAAERRIAELANALREAGHSSSLVAAQRDQHLVECGKARQAQTLMSEAAPGYALVEAAQKKLAVLEIDRRERDHLNDGLSTAHGDLKQVSGTIEQLERQRAETVAAAAEAATLVSVVNRQIDLEVRREQALRIIANRETLEHRLAQQKSQILSLQSEIEHAEKQRGESNAARDRVSKAGDPQGQLDDVMRSLGEIAPLTREMETIREQGLRLRKQHSMLIADVQRWQELCAEQERVRAVAAVHGELQTRLQNVRDEQTRITAALEYQAQARVALLKRHCPLLDVQCPAVSADPSLLSSFDLRDQEFASHHASLADEYAVIAPRYRAAEAALEQLHRLQVDIAALEGSRARLEEIDSQLTACGSRYRELEAHVDGALVLERRRLELRDIVAQTRRDEQIAAALPALDAQLKRDIGHLASAEATRGELENEREAMRAHEETVRETEIALQALGYPRERQQGLLNTAATQSKVESDLLVQHTRLLTATDRVKTLMDALERFRHLDTNVDEQAGLVSQHQSAYVTYLREKPVADTLHACETSLAETEKQLTALLATESEARAQLSAAQSEYKAALHAEVRAGILTAEGRLGASKAQSKHQASEVERVQNEHTRLVAVEERLQVRRGEFTQLARTHTVLKFVRETIKESGPAVTGALLRNISEGANDIYAEIMDDHAPELRWDEEYDIVVQRGADERSFAQLSGGEQMSAALAVRLALLKEMSDVDFAFFDEPTQNMDLERRTNLADQIRSVRGFEQLIVISHDDAFEHHTDNLIRLRKIGEETVAE